MCREKLNPVDVQENQLLELHKDLLTELLRDHATGKNIIWATDDYAYLGAGYGAGDEILPELITGERSRIIMPRSVKTKEAQSSRTRNMAEVFTPTWICNEMNNLADAAWFGRENVFNSENGPAWTETPAKIVFPNKNKRGIGSWTAYLAAKRLEITCGEVPYLVSRYDAATGEPLPLERRVGLLDRKLRVVNERTRNLRDKRRAQKRWLQLAKLALQSVYGFEWQGDNVLLARENILYSVLDYFAAKFGEPLPQTWLPPLAWIISWNIWQMDGIKCVVPNSCHDYKTRRKPVEPSIFDKRNFSVSALKHSAGFCDVDENELQKCQGCLKDNMDWHNGTYCKIKNWSTGKVLRFKDLLGRQGSEVGMEKDFKFDVVIGNPPYQQDTAGAGRQARPVYNFFVEQAKTLNPQYIVMITPSRWFSGGMGLDNFRENMVQDTHILKLVDYTNAKDCFPNISIGGGVNYFIWKKDYNGLCEFTNIKSGVVSTLKRSLNEFTTLVRYNEAIPIIRKIAAKKEIGLDTIISSLMPYGLNTSYRGTQNKTEENTIRLYASNGETYVSREAISKGFESIDKYKVLVSKTSAEHAGEPGSDGKFKVIPSSMKVISPGEICTHSYFVIGCFDNKKDAENVYSYLKTKFVRFLMLLCISGFGLSKIVFPFVPMQDFSKSWTDAELYKKYNLTQKEISFIESMIKPMD